MTPSEPVQAGTTIGMGAAGSGAKRHASGRNSGASCRPDETRLGSGAEDTRFRRPQAEKEAKPRFVRARQASGRRPERWFRLAAASACMPVRRTAEEGAWTPGGPQAGPLRSLRCPGAMAARSARVNARGRRTGRRAPNGRDGASDRHPACRRSGRAAPAAGSRCARRCHPPASGKSPC